MALYKFRIIIIIIIAFLAVATEAAPTSRVAVSPEYNFSFDLAEFMLRCLHLLLTSSCCSVLRNRYLSLLPIRTKYVSAANLTRSLEMWMDRRSAAIDKYSDSPNPDPCIILAVILAMAEITYFYSDNVRPESRQSSCRCCLERQVQRRSRLQCLRLHTSD